MTKPLSPTKNADVLNFLYQGLSYTEIKIRTGVARGSITKIAQEHIENIPKNKAGPSQKTSNQTRRLLVRNVKSAEWPEAVSTQKALVDTINIHVEVNTI